MMFQITVLMCLMGNPTECLDHIFWVESHDPLICDNPGMASTPAMDAWITSHPDYVVVRKYCTH